MAFMSRTETASTVWLTQRMCLSCGFHGHELQGDRGDQTFACPCCGGDLYARPPMSYARMEGLIEEDGTLHDSVIRASAAVRRPRGLRFSRLFIRMETAMIVSMGLLAVLLVGAGIVQDMVARL